MRQLIQSYRTGEMRVEEVPPPALLPGGVLVRTHRSLVSAGTEKMIVDLARKPLLAKARARPDLVRKVVDSARKQGLANTLRKVQSRLETPIPLGYSSAGVVTEVSAGAAEFRVGDRVSCAGAGYANHADYSFVPRNLCAKVPQDVSWDGAAFATVGAIALQGVIDWAGRYAEATEAAAGDASDPVVREAHLRVAEACRRVPARPARSLFEGLQVSAEIAVREIAGRLEFSESEAFGRAQKAGHDRQPAGFVKDTFQVSVGIRGSLAQPSILLSRRSLKAGLQAVGCGERRNHLPTRRCQRRYP